MSYDKLIEECPIFFRHLKYIEASDGWLEIVAAACKLIENNIHQRYCLFGNAFDEELTPAASQIKSKFGTLRLYYNNYDHFTDGVIKLAERLSAHTCEECGLKGQRVNLGWLWTLCPKHHQEKVIKRADGAL